jgi:hypothetical protein
MHTTWRDPPTVPADYHDVRQLVGLARQARRKTVEFDWGFSEDELRRLRAAAHYWGSPTTGRYKAFDARVIAAINQALGEPNSIHQLKEPSNMRGLDAVVRCEREAEVYRLRGHATFDIVFGYGYPGAAPRPDVMSRIGQDVLDRLTATVHTLGWDLQRLRSLPAVAAAMYGFTPAHVAPPTPPSAEPAETIDMKLQGPFTLTQQPGLRCLFTDPVAKRIGIYLWTVQRDGVDHVTYVGQTRRTFGQRTAEHVRGMLSGEYSVQDPATLHSDRQTLVWPSAGGDKVWPATLPDFIDRLPEMAGRISQMLQTVRVHVAVLEDDAHLFSRLEGAVGRHFAKHSDEKARQYFGAGIKLPAAIPGERALSIRVGSEAEIAGLVDWIAC